jgi:hypothetical protein
MLQRACSVYFCTVLSILCTASEHRSNHPSPVVARGRPDIKSGCSPSVSHSVDENLLVLGRLRPAKGRRALGRGDEICANWREL